MILAFEGGRGLAAVFVALYHLLWESGYFSVIRNAYVFVDLFFVLSGFLMYSLYAKKLHSPNEFKPFVIRRFGRLFPLMAFSTLFYIFCHFLVIFLKRKFYIATEGISYANSHFMGYPYPKINELLSTLTFTNGLGFFNRNVLNEPTWSISTEFYTYILFAIFCFFTRTKKLVISLAIFSMLSYALTVWGSVDIHQCLVRGKCLDVAFDFGFPRCIAAFFIGAIASAYCNSGMKFNIYYLQISGIILLVLLLSTMDNYPGVAFAFPITFSILVVSVSTDEGPLAAVLKLKIFQIMGQRSFSIYLMHASILLFFREFIQKIGLGLPLFLFALFYITIIIMISKWTYKFIENPFRILFNRIATKGIKCEKNIATSGVQ